MHLLDITKPLFIPEMEKKLNGIHEITSIERLVNRINKHNISYEGM